MSKKKIYNKHLQKGRFYTHSDRQGGHPALLYKKRDQKNMYFVVLFTSSPGKKRFKLKHSLDQFRKQNYYVHDYPSISRRRDLGRKPLTRLKLNKEDKPIVKMIEKKKWLIGSSKSSDVRVIALLFKHDLKSFAIIISLGLLNVCFSQLGSYFINIQLTSPTQTRMIFIGTKAKLAKSPVRSKLVW